MVCHDLLLLPVLFTGLEWSERIHKDGVRHTTRVIFDTQEFYPLQNTSSLCWRVLFKRFNSYLYATYMPKADRVFAASSAFCEMYKKHFEINAHPLMPLPPFYNLTPRAVNAECIKILYHSALNQNCGIDEVIELCQWLDERFCIDFIFVGWGQRVFRTKIESRIQALQSQGKHIRILSPLPLNQIVPFGNSYDIGFIYVSPHNYNPRSTLSNKFLNTSNHV
ncbi:hypothetical protein [uncultured Helicobacter sp.]|nr:hypothetical protein [uncultured Helicobacter sp.]